MSEDIVRRILEFTEGVDRIATEISETPVADLARVVLNESSALAKDCDDLEALVVTADISTDDAEFIACMHAIRECRELANNLAAIARQRPAQ